MQPTRKRQLPLYNQSIESDLIWWPLPFYRPGRSPVPPWAETFCYPSVSNEAGVNVFSSKARRRRSSKISSRNWAAFSNFSSRAASFI